MIPSIRHALVQRNVGFYSVCLPPDYESTGRQYPVCVLLHGQGSTERKIVERVVPTVGSEGLIFVAPRAPHAHEEVFVEAKEAGWRAWPMHWARWRDSDFPRDDVVAADVPALYTDWIADCILDTQRRYRTKEGPVVVIGGSEGATYAHALACHRPGLVRAYFAHAGGPYDFTLADASSAQALEAHSIRPFLSHYREDSENRFEGTETLARYLDTHAVAYESYFPAGTHHAFTPEVLERARAFVRAQTEGEERA